MFNVERMRKRVYRSIPDELIIEIDPMSTDADLQYRRALREFELSATKKYGAKHHIDVVTYGRYDYADTQVIKFTMRPARGQVSITNWIDEPRG